MPEYAALDRLQRALNPLPGLAVDGAHQLSVTGTVNIIGGGSGGTSMVDNNPFTPGSTSITPMGGYHGGRTVASGNAAAVQIDGSGNLQVNVVAGGAGGGIANISVRGTGNSDIHVGFASGANLQQDGGAALPITGTVAVGGIAGSVFVTQGTLPMPVVGSMGVTPLASFTVNMGSVATVNLGLGTVNIGNNPTVVVGSISAGSMNVLAGQAGAPWSMTGSVNAFSQITVQGTNNAAVHVGFASGAGVFADGGAALPITGTVNMVGGGGGFATAAVYGSPAFPVYAIGSVNVVNNVGIFGSVSATGSVNVAGSLLAGVLTGVGSLPVTVASFMYADSTNSAIRVNVVTGGAGGGVANLTVVGTANTQLHVGQASTNVNVAWPQMPNVDGAAWLPVAFASGFFPTVNIAGIGADTTNSALRVNVVAGGAGGGVANLTVVGTANTAFHIGQASTNVNVAWPQMPNVDGAAWLPVAFASGYFPTVNNGPIVGSVNVTGSLNPVGIFGSVNVLGTTTMGAIATVNLGLGTVNIGNGIIGSVNITGSLNPVGVLGSVSVLGSVNLGGVGKVDVRGSMVPTTWPISFGGSGYSALVVASANPAVAPYITGVWFIATGTLDISFQSPSGTFLTGSMRILPGAGIGGPGAPMWPTLIGATNATFYIQATGTQNIGGIMTGYIA